MEPLKKKIFKVIEQQIPIKEFESWLYNQQALAGRMDEDLILELFSFNYNQKDVHYEFKRKLLPYFDQNEFIQWKVVNNLTTLSKGCTAPMRILEDFYWLSEEGRCTFLWRMACMMYELEDAEYALEVGESSYYRSKQEILNDIQREAQELLQGLLKWLEAKPDEDIKNFVYDEEATEKVAEEKAPQVQLRKWWQFWK